MKNILKVALVAIVSTCNADVPAGMNNYRARFEHDITTKILEATKSPEVKQIISGLNNPKAKLTGFVLRDIEIYNGVYIPTRSDVLVSLHDNKPSSYHILFGNSALLDFSRQNIPQVGYYLLNDELKNKINASTQKSSYEIAPLRQEILKESFKNPGVEFDHVKFLKENQLTREKINKNAVETLTQVNQATKMKQDTYKFFHNLSLELIKDKSVITKANSIFDDFITKMIDVTNPTIGFDETRFANAFSQFATKEFLHPSNITYKAFNNCKSFFERYAQSLNSLNSLKDQCKYKIFSTFGNKDAPDAISEKIHQNIVGILQYTNNSFQPGYSERQKYDAKKIKDAIQAIKNEVAKIADADIKTKISQLINGYESSIEEFDFSEEIGNAIYLDTMYFSLDSQDSENKMKLLDLSRQNKIVSKLFEHDLIFPTTPYPNISFTVTTLLRDYIDSHSTFFGMSLYNSVLNSEIKHFLSKKNGDKFNVLSEFFAQNGEFILNNKILFIKLMKNDVSVSGKTLNKFTTQDYLNLYNSLLVFTDSLAMNKLRTLERFLNVPNVINQGPQPLPQPLP